MFHFDNYNIQNYIRKYKILILILILTLNNSVYSNNILNNKFHIDEFITRSKNEQLNILKKMILKKKFLESTIYAVNSIKKYPKDNNIKILYCIALNKMDEFITTSIILSQMSNIRSKDYFIVLSESYFMSGQTEKLEKVILKMNSYFPESSEIYALKGAINAIKAKNSSSFFNKMKYLRKSKKYLKKSILKDPDNWYANTILGVISLATSNKRDADKYFRKINLKEGFPLKNYKILKDMENL